MQTMPLKAAALEFQDSGNDVLVHDREHAKIHVVNRTAAEILRACDGRTPVRTIAERFDRSRASEIEYDITGALAQFAALGLLES